MLRFNWFGFMNRRVFMMRQEAVVGQVAKQMLRARFRISLDDICIELGRAGIADSERTAHSIIGSARQKLRVARRATA